MLFLHYMNCSSLNFVLFFVFNFFALNAICRMICFVIQNIYLMVFCVLIIFIFITICCNMDYVLHGAVCIITFVQGDNFERTKACIADLHIQCREQVKLRLRFRKLQLRSCIMHFLNNPTQTYVRIYNVFKYKGLTK